MTSKGVSLEVILKVMPYSCLTMIQTTPQMVSMFAAIALRKFSTNAASNAQCVELAMEITLPNARLL